MRCADISKCYRNPSVFHSIVFGSIFFVQIWFSNLCVCIFFLVPFPSSSSFSDKPQSVSASSQWHTAFWCNYLYKGYNFVWLSSSDLKCIWYYYSYFFLLLFLVVLVMRTSETRASECGFCCRNEIFRFLFFFFLDNSRFLHSFFLVLYGTLECFQ